MTPRRRAGDAAQVHGTAPATFGELVQGRTPDSGFDFLVTLPITLESTARFVPFSGSSRLYVVPHGKTKSLKAATLLLQAWGIQCGGLLHVVSGVSEGKGLASSSADLVATLRAVAACFQRLLPLELICSILRDIEPTDGVMFDESVTFFHRRVELDRVIGRLPRMCIVALDEGGVIDTVAYNRNRFVFGADEQRRYGELIAEVVAGITQGDLQRIGRAATESARLHQRRNPKQSFDRLEALLAPLGALGVVTCHSGTCIGLCFDAGSPEALEAISVAQRRLAAEFGQPTFRFFTR